MNAIAYVMYIFVTTVQIWAFQTLHKAFFLEM